MITVPLNIVTQNIRFLITWFSGPLTKHIFYHHYSLLIVTNRDLFYNFRKFILNNIIKMPKRRTLQEFTKIKEIQFKTMLIITGFCSISPGNVVYKMNKSNHLIFFVYYNLVFVVTEFVITKFNCNAIRHQYMN